MDYATLIVLGTVFSLVLAVVWIILPFAIFGTKPILQQIRRASVETNQQLAEITRLQKATVDEVHLASQRLLEVKMAIELLAKVSERGAPGRTGAPPPGP